MLLLLAAGVVIKSKPLFSDVPKQEIRGPRGQIINNGLNIYVREPIDGAVVIHNQVVISGEISEPTDFKINGKSYNTNAAGIFKEIIELSPGLNSVDIVASKGGRSGIKKMSITYEPIN